MDVVRVVREARACGLCRQRKESLTPSMAAGFHEPVGSLHAATVDAVHRITTDPGRLTLSWYREGVLGNGISAPRFVEIVGYVSAVVMTDTLAFAVGATAPPFPE